MATKDIHNQLNFVQGIYPAVVTAAKPADNAADMQGYEGCEIEFAIGAVTGATPTITPLIEESADNITFTPVAAADLLGGALPAVFDTTYQNTVVKRGYRGVQRYVRARYSAVGGTSPSFTTSIQIVQGSPRHAPTPSTN